MASYSNDCKVKKHNGIADTFDGEARRTMNASKNPRWNDYIIGTNGYKKIRVGTVHPLADSKGYVYEHLLVWVSAGHSRPHEGQGLHHRNWDRLDNRLSNLQMLTVTDHRKLHVAKQRRDKKGMFAQ